MNKTAQVLFNYLRDVLYSPRDAFLDAEALPEDFRTLGQGMLYLGGAIDEQRELARALARGNLSGRLPPPDNELAAPLKALQASLKHITWQSQQVAKGDYQQRVEFMGEFADAFNSMTAQLEQRQRALEAEIESSRQKTLALEQCSSLFETITDRIAQCILVADAENGDILFLNNFAREAMKGTPELKRQTDAWVADFIGKRGARPAEAAGEFCYALGGGTRVMAVQTYPVHSHARPAVALVISDVSEARAQMQRLEEYAYRDGMTKVNSRFYGMQVLRDWLEEGRVFCICFADLDSLKYVNDTFGHSEGDRYIISAAETMVSLLPGAVIARLGGDEFMALMPGCAEPRGELAMKKVRDRLLATNRAGPHRYRRSVSYGVVAVDETRARMPASALLGLADARMYEFKRANKAAAREA